MTVLDMVKQLKDSLKHLYIQCTAQVKQEFA